MQALDRYEKKPSTATPSLSQYLAPSLSSPPHRFGAGSLKSNFRKVGRPSNSRSNSMYSALNMPRTNGNVGGQGSGTGNTSDGHANEFTSLLARPLHNSEGEPLWQDRRAYVKWPATFLYRIFQTLISNPVNVLLVFVPLGIISGAVGWSPTATFILNFLAIIPLASLLSFATEELSVKLGQTLGGLLNASFGNAVELIVSIIALKEGQIRIVQSSMLGSILSNILLVLGCCFLAGGLTHKEQSFNGTVASTMSSLMAVSAASLIIPATLYNVMRNSSASIDKDKNVLILSHGTAVILLVIYVLYLVFQLKTHANLFDEEQNEEGDGGEKEPEILSPPAAAVALIIVTVCVAVCAEYLVDSIDSIVETAHISKTFIGLILLPIVGNAAEHVTACVVAYKDKMDLAIGVAIGSSMQIALLVTPFLVILGWIINQPMTLHFETFETVVFFLSVLITNYLIADGKSNYLEGAMLVGMYTIIALAFYVYPDDIGKGANGILTFLGAGSS
ncbi:endo-1,3-beta glucanase [Lecanora helva]